MAALTRRAFTAAAAMLVGSRTVAGGSNLLGATAATLVAAEEATSPLTPVKTIEPVSSNELYSKIEEHLGIRRIKDLEYIRSDVMMYGDRLPAKYASKRSWSASYKMDAFVEDLYLRKRAMNLLHSHSEVGRQFRAALGLDF